jgi:serine protease Do
MNTYKFSRVLLVALFAFWLMVTGAVNAADTGLEAAFSMQRAFVEVAKQLKPSVVNIRVERSASGQIRWATPDDDNESVGPEEFFRHFFRGNGFKFNQPEEYKVQAAGSGVIFGAEGTILTNKHVVKDASRIVVKFQDGTELDAEIAGQDPQTDLAVIKVKNAKNLKVAEFADSDQVEVGQWCIAVGNPLGLEQTVTVGVVSAVGRSGIGATAIEDFIQTDASINPGNSGGPLVDLHGRVIGINTLIFNAPGSGIGFAIPANMASRIAAQLAAGNRVQRPYIGITMQPLTDELAGHFGLKDRDGAVVMQLVDKGPAEKAGIKPMDIIRKIDGRVMKNTNDVQKYVLSRDLNKEIEMEILRNGKTLKLKVMLEQMPDSYGLDSAEMAASPSPSKGSGLAADLGFSAQKLTSEQARTLGAKDAEGLAVTSVKNGSLADAGGLKTGDIINQINGQDIRQESDIEPALKEGSAKKSSVFLVNRAGTPMFLVVPHEKKQ